MRTKKVSSIVRKALNDQSGQVLPYLTLMMAAIIGMGGLTLDIGQAYILKSQLQNSVTAAALAASQQLYTTNGVQDQVNLYGTLNHIAAFGTSTPSVSSICLNLLLQGTGLTCNANSAANAVRVTQTASSPTIFMRFFGITSVPVKATATAAIQGVANPWNVAIILDATPSMNTTDSNCGGVSEFQCAEQSIQVFLNSIVPCPTGVTYCPTGANLRVALFSFPNVVVPNTTTTTVAADTCGGGTAYATAFSTPPIGATSYTPIQYDKIVATTKKGTTTWTSTPLFTTTYQITPFVSDFYKNGAINTSSAIVKAVGSGGNAGCMQSPNWTDGTVSSYNNLGGGGITYYAGAIYAAQAALAQQQAANPGSKNAIIFLSDGQANIASSDFASNLSVSGGTVVSDSTTPDANYVPSATNTPPSELALNDSSSGTGSHTKGLYPASADQCQQAILAAQYATNANTVVFGVAYGSEQSGCYTTSQFPATDTTLVATGSNLIIPLNTPFTLSQLVPCMTIRDIASPPTGPITITFFSDYKQSGSGIDTTCVSPSPTINLSDILPAIGANFTNPRLLPNNAS